MSICRLSTSVCLLSCVASLASPLFSTPGDNGLEDGPVGFAPALLIGKQFTLEGIDSSGVSETVTVFFRDGGLFDATWSAAKGSAADATGSYTYQRTGLYTGTWTILSAGPNRQSCTAHISFTAANSGAYTSSCTHGPRRTGSFQMAHEDPFCRSLWDGLACSTVANLPHVYLGPAGSSTATAEVVFSSTDPNPAECEVALLFHQGTSQAPPVRFNGRPAEENLFHLTVSREGAAIVTLTAPEAQKQLVGALYVYGRSPCSATSLEVQGRTLIEQADGRIEELFSHGSQSPGEWLGDGDCRVLTGVFANGRNLGFAAVTTQPGGRAPGGTRLRFRAFDAEGAFVGAPAGVSLTGTQELYWPWEFSEARTIEMCLEVPGVGNFQVAVMPVASQTGGSREQFVAQRFADGFREAEVTAWGVEGASGEE